MNTSDNTPLHTVQVGQVGRDEELVGNGAIESSVHKLQIQHDLAVKVLVMINSSFVNGIDISIPRGSLAYELQVACTSRTWPVRLPLPLADLPPGCPS